MAGQCSLFTCSENGADLGSMKSNRIKHHLLLGQVLTCCVLKEVIGLTCKTPEKPWTDRQQGRGEQAWLSLSGGVGWTPAVDVTCWTSSALPFVHCGADTSRPCFVCTLVRLHLYEMRMNITVRDGTQHVLAIAHYPSVQTYTHFNEISSDTELKPRSKRGHHVSGSL